MRRWWPVILAVGVIVLALVVIVGARSNEPQWKADLDDNWSEMSGEDQQAACDGLVFAGKDLVGSAAVNTWGEDVDPDEVYDYLVAKCLEVYE